MPKHAGPSRPSDTQIADQARAAAAEIRGFLTEPGITASEAERMTGADMANWLHDRNWRRNQALGRALALLEIMAGDK